MIADENVFIKNVKISKVSWYDIKTFFFSINLVLNVCHSLFVCIYRLCVCVCVCMRACVYICVCVCVCIYIYIYIYMHFQPGCYIQVCIARINREIFKTFAMMENKPLIVVALLPYEHKMSLVNIMLKRSSYYTHPIKSKERLIFQCGFRRFTACPIFSQHTNGTKHKVSQCAISLFKACFIL